MNNDNPPIPNEHDLDEQWDDLVVGFPNADLEPTIADLHLRDAGQGPSPRFKQQLRAAVEAAATEKATRRREERPEPIPNGYRSSETIQPVATASARRMARPGLTFGKFASLLMAASLLIAMTTAVIRYPFGDSDGPDEPTNGAQTTAIPAAGSPAAPGEGKASSADPGNTNVQPGPAPQGPIALRQQVQITGSAMALGEGMLVVVNGAKVTALDPETLAEQWSVELDEGLYTEPVIAGEAVYFGYTEKPEWVTEYILGPKEHNQLVSLSLTDGSVNWRLDDAGAFPYEPVVVDGVIYSVGNSETSFHLAAYDAETGSERWVAEDFPTTVYPDSGGQIAVYLDMVLAYGDGDIIVNQFQELSAYDAQSGGQVWSHPVTEPNLVGAPLIADGTVITTIGHQWLGEGKPGSAKVVAFDLRSGQERWSREPVSGNMFHFFSATQRGDDVVTVQLSAEDEWKLVAIAGDTGEQAWSVLSQDAAADPAPDFWHAPDSVASAGDLAFTVGVASDQGDQPRTLVTAREIATGDVAWTAIVNGSAVAAPIVAGGRVYVLTDLYGLWALGTESSAAASPDDGVADLRTPVECAVEPVESPLLGDAPTDREPAPALKDGLFAWLDIDEAPAFDAANAVEPAVAEAIADRFAEYRDCVAFGETGRLYPFFSTDYWLRLRALGPGAGDLKEESGGLAVRIAGSSEYLDLDQASLQTLPDGRVGGIASGDSDVYIVFVEEDGEWRVDEFHRIFDRQESPETTPDE
jgi:outer membrane protein assembly factor BamB